MATNESCCQIPGIQAVEGVKMPGVIVAVASFAATLQAGGEECEGLSIRLRGWHICGYRYCGADRSSTR